MADQSEGGVRRWSRGAVLTVAILAAAGTRWPGLLVNIMERKGKRRCLLPRRRTDRRHHRSGDLGKNFPQQYDGYLRTVDQQRTRYGGSEAMPHSPTESDPRSVVAQSGSKKIRG